MKDFFEVSFKNSTVFIRCDFNVPVTAGVISDTRRIDDSLLLIKHLLSLNNKLVICSHMGRPNGTFDEKHSLKVVYDYLCKTLPNVKIHFVVDLFKDYSKSFLNSKLSEIIFLENIRFFPEEETNNENFKRFLSTGVDFYCNDAFSCSHRSHSSIMMADLFTSDKKIAGLSFSREVKMLRNIIQHRDRETLVIIGGSKISTKIGIVRQLQKKVDKMIIVGAMANTLWHYKGYDVGNSMYEKNCEDACRNILSDRNCNVILPEYFVVTDNIKNPTLVKTKHISDISGVDIIVDVGVKSIDYLCEIIKGMKIVLWNGPLGVFEIEPFDKGTSVLAKKIIEFTKSRAITSIIGGGDTLSAVKKSVNIEDFTFASTAGGAFLEYIENDGDLVGIRTLKSNYSVFNTDISLSINTLGAPETSL